MVKKHFGQVPHPVPIPAIIVLVIAWYLGKQYDKYVYLSTRDSLTGLYNRRYVTDNFPKLSRYANRRKLNICTLLVDVNDFKEINDHYGHDAGDVVLVNISKILCDSFGQRSIIARWGGDEFLVLVFVSDVNVIIDEINDFNSKIKNEDWKHKSIGTLSVSVGKATYPTDATSLKELVAKADNSMYEYKIKHKMQKLL
ncbi:hypothetical protein AC625_09515 [Peribacillus loiseleuriae]|uniref:GGDEF domain-containing protein n=2 Tax=Peribacillus loiseleuriae TaxID=1679170 RepID=A0A0K9GZY9_9BACI|nr:hypothetical protein AC625_09515 [Peribacillus loiseleuriae]